MNPHKKFFSKIGANYLIYGVVTLIFQIIMVNAVSYLNAPLLADYDNLVILMAFCNYVLPLPIILFLMKRLDSQKLETTSITITTFIKYVCITLTLMWIGNIAGLIITDAIGNLIQTPVSNPVHELINSSDIWLNLLLVSIIGPIFEELIFRKLLIDRSIRYGARVSIILSALLFGFFHGNLNQFFYAFLMGGFFAYVYIKTGKIIYPIMLHVIVNLMGSVVSVFIAQSATKLIQGPFSAFDMGIVLLYIALLATAFFVGLVSLLGYRKSKFNGKKTEIGLRQPIRTMILNFGMIAFMGFCIFEMVYQILC